MIVAFVRHLLTQAKLSKYGFRQCDLGKLGAWRLPELQQLSALCDSENRVEEQSVSGIRLNDFQPAHGGRLPNLVQAV